MITSHSVLFGMKGVSEKKLLRKKYTFLSWIVFLFRKLCTFMR